MVKRTRFTFTANQAFSGSENLENDSNDEAAASTPGVSIHSVSLPVSSEPEFRNVSPQSPSLSLQSADSESEHPESESDEDTNSQLSTRSLTPNPAFYREWSDSENEAFPSSPPNEPDFEDGLAPWFCRPLYPNALSNFTAGEYSVRLLHKALVENTPRKSVRAEVKFYSEHLNHIDPSTEFPQSLDALLKAIGYDPHDGIRYEVCSKKLSNGEYCKTTFPHLNNLEKSEHIHNTHTCPLCVCQTLRDGVICGQRRFEGSPTGGGRVQALAGGIYLGLAQGFKMLIEIPAYENDRSQFLAYRESVRFGPKSARSRGMRWHDSPNGIAMENKYVNEVTQRKSITFFATFWDYVELAGTSASYSVGMLLVHVVDLLMVHVGKAQYIFLIQITFGPKKCGHYDAHGEQFYAELKELEVDGLDGNVENRFVLAKVYADRPAMEGQAGLCGHNSAKGCGFCSGGQSFFNGAQRYVGYSLEGSNDICDLWGKARPQPVVVFSEIDWLQYGVRADEGDTDSPLKRASGLFHNAAPHLDARVNAVLPLAHAAGHGVCGNFIDIAFCKEADNPPVQKLSAPGKATLRTILAGCEIPNDASRALDFFTTRRGYMTFVEEAECVGFVLSVVMPLLIGDLPEAEQEEHEWYLLALELLGYAVRWYFFGVTPDINPLTNSPFVSFQEKVRFAQTMSLRYAILIEKAGIVKCLTYNLHAMVYHFPFQEIEGGALCCDNELFGERFLKVVSKLGEGKVQTPCVELTVAHKVSQVRVLANVEGKLRRRGVLTKSYTGHDVVGTDEVPSLFNRLTRVDLETHPNLLMLLQEGFGVGQEEALIGMYASAIVNGLHFNGVYYRREHARSSYWVSYNKENSPAVCYACVQFFLRVGDGLAVMNELDVLNVDKYGALDLQIPAYPKLVVIPVRQLRFKLMVYKKAGTTFLRAAEWLHLRVKG